MQHAQQNQANHLHIMYMQCRQSPVPVGVRWEAVHHVERNLRDEAGVEEEEGKEDVLGNPPLVADEGEAQRVVQELSASVFDLRKRECVNTSELTTSVTVSCPADVRVAKLTMTMSGWLYWRTALLCEYGTPSSGSQPDFFTPSAMSK